MSVRISATDWVDGGITPDDAVEIARAFKDAGADLIDVSLGPNVARGKTGIRTHVPNAVSPIGSATKSVSRRWRSATSSNPTTSTASSPPGRADLCALGRPHLADPYWTLHAAAQARLHRPEMAGAISAGQIATRTESRSPR